MNLKICLCRFRTIEIWNFLPRKHTNCSLLCLVFSGTAVVSICPKLYIVRVFKVCLVACVNYLVGVVSADVAECGGSRLTEQCRGVALRAVHVYVFRVRDIGERRREDGRRTCRGGGSGREAGQTLCEAVHVDLDLWVVKVLLSITVVRVAVSAVGDEQQLLRNSSESPKWRLF